jgi:hypothetical protein
MSNRERNAWLAILLVLFAAGLLYGMLVPVIHGQSVP